MEIKIAFDIGGTFTDFALVDEQSGEILVGKTLTTPHKLSDAVGRGIISILQRAHINPNNVRKAVHGATTVITNALIEGKGAKTALITTEGFRDILEMRNELRYDLYQMRPNLPNPLVPRELRFTVKERIGKNGEIFSAMEDQDVTTIVDELLNRGVQSIAVCLLHSFMNGIHERRIGEIVDRLKTGVSVTLSCDLLPEIREYGRASTTVANAYVQPIVEPHIRDLEEVLENLELKTKLYFMHSGGGMVSGSTAGKYPIRMVESGPAAGALVATYFAELIGKNNILSFDMGGTTAKICLIKDLRPSITTDFEVARVHRFKKGSGIPIKVPVIDMIEIGAGGGSIARVDSLGLLKVGPESAGADPGPACYGLGGKLATVTDADLFLGYMDPRSFLGGEMELLPSEAENAMEQLASRLKSSLLYVANGIRRVVNENMSGAAKVHVAEQGRDPRSLTMIAFGGAGPMHAVEIGKILGLRLVVVPLFSGAFSAVGLLVAAPSLDFVRSDVCRLDSLDWANTQQIIGNMISQGEKALQEVGVYPSDAEIEASADMRFVGQGFEVTTPFPIDLIHSMDAAKIEEAFKKAYTEKVTTVMPHTPVEVVSWRITVRGKKARVKLAHEKSGSVDAKKAIKGSRPVFFAEIGDYVDTVVYDHYRLLAGNKFAGPAIVEQRESTTVINPNTEVTVDEFLNLLITIKS